MGSCLSCFGLLGSSDDDEDNPETSRLLSSDPYRSYNGLDGRQHRMRDPHQHPMQPDPEALRRERQALQRLCHGLAEDTVDAFGPLPLQRNSKIGSARSQQNSDGSRKNGTPLLIRPQNEGTEEEDEEEEDSLDEEDQEDSDVNEDDDESGDEESQATQRKIVDQKGQNAVEEPADLPIENPRTPIKIGRLKSVRRLRKGGSTVYLDNSVREAAKIALG